MSAPGPVSVVGGAIGMNLLGDLAKQAFHVSTGPEGGRLIGTGLSEALTLPRRLPSLFLLFLRLGLNPGIFRRALRLFVGKSRLDGVEFDHAASHELVVAAREFRHFGLGRGQFQFQFSDLLRQLRELQLQMQVGIRYCDRAMTRCRGAGADVQQAAGGGNQLRWRVTAIEQCDVGILLPQIAVGLDWQNACRKQVGDLLRPLAAIIAGNPAMGFLPERLVLRDPLALFLPGSTLFVLAIACETAFHQ